jgi:hypothetical protein
MIYVYKTTVQSAADAISITNLILNEIPSCDISFDLDDCDNVLRIESNNGEIDKETIHRIFKQKNHSLESLPY